MTADGRDYVKIHSDLQAKFNNSAVKETAACKWIGLALCGERDPKDTHDPADHMIRELMMPSIVP
jgi:hypothetical protein